MFDYTCLSAVPFRPHHHDRDYLTFRILAAGAIKAGVIADWFHGMGSGSSWRSTAPVPYQSDD